MRIIFRLPIILLILIHIMPINAKASEISELIRVAVMAFSTPKDRPDVEQYGEGTMDSLITGLKHIPKFVMLDRGRIDRIIKEQAFQLSGAVDPESAVKVGKLLGAQTLISGSIQVAGGSIRIIANFVDVESGKVNDSQKVTGSINNIFDLQDQLAGLFLKNQNIKVTTEQETRLTKSFKSTYNLTAYDYYLKGRKSFLSATPEGYNDSLKWYSEAIKIDAKYALSYTGFAETMIALGWANQQSGQDYKRNYEQAYKYSEKAVQIDPNIPDAYRVLGHSLFVYLHKIKEAQNMVKKALELNPNDGLSWYVLWIVSFNTANRDPDHEYIRKASELMPDSFIIRNDRGNAYARAKRFEKAIVEYNAASLIEPNNGIPLYNLACIFALRGENEQALKYLKKAILLTPFIKKGAQHDRDLDNLKNNEEYRKLIFD